MTQALTPKSAGFYQPAEWAPHEAVWLAWPSHKDLWQDDLVVAQEEFIGFCEAIADFDALTAQPHGERMHILVPDIKSGGDAESALGHLPIQIHLIPFGDIWLRDTAPVFLKGPEDQKATVRFGFNGWGGKYSLPDDQEVAQRIAQTAAFSEFTFSFVLEGGSIEVDGEGTCLTSRQCLLNANRNPAMTLEEIESSIMNAFGVEKVLWVGNGLLNDHTDGHIDTVARFASPGVVLCMKASGHEDPNHQILERIASELRTQSDAKGRKLTVIEVPSPGAVVNNEGELMPASYLNFYISNSSVIVPIYGSPYDDEAVRVIATCFPGRKTVGLPAKAILTGGGAFHCISQQMPR